MAGDTNLSLNYDDVAVAGTAACIQEPEDEHDQALSEIFQWYLLHYQRGLTPPVPQTLIRCFRELADPDENWQQTIEITIALAYQAAHPTNTDTGTPLDFRSGLLIARTIMVAIRIISGT